MSRARPSGADADRWLEPWWPQLAAAAAHAPVLELGCDTGGDTRWLVERGLRVVATDIDAAALQACARAAPAALQVRHDLRTPLPFADGTFGAVVASLCLHYFDWATTERAVAEVRRCLVPGGLLLCRLNSVRDVLHGALDGDEIEPGLRRVHGTYAVDKRFFARPDLERLLPAAAWRWHACREQTIHRYAQPKVAWELVLTPG
jgi:SAM-dependent methyltransferase